MNRTFPLLLTALLISACSAQDPAITYTRISGHDEPFKATVPGVAPPSVRQYDLFFTSREPLPSTDGSEPVWLSVLCSLTDDAEISQPKYYIDGPVVPDTSATQGTYRYRARIEFAESIDDGAAQARLDTQMLNILLSRREWIGCTVVTQRGASPAVHSSTWRVPAQDILREVNR